MDRRMIIGASMGNCVHVAGVAHFLNLAEDQGYRTVYAGPAVKVDAIIEQAGKLNADIVALSYRLTPENVVPLVEELREKSKTLTQKPVWVFGGTAPVAAVVEKLGFFDKIFDSTEDIDDCIAYLRGVQRGDLYIFTHPEFKDGIRAKYESMMRAYPTDQKPDPDREYIFKNFFTFLTNNPIYLTQEQR